MARPSLERIWAESPSQFEEPTDAIWTLGWEGGATKQPPRAKYENWWHNRVDQLLRQLERDGAMEWLAVTPYSKWAMVNASDGELYLAIQPSTGVDPVSDDGTYWLTVPDYIKSLFNAQGAAPLFGVRAWGNFNGLDGSVALRAGGNVASVSRIGVGLYQITFQTPMIDSDYSVSPGVSTLDSSGPGGAPDSCNPYDFQPSGFKMSCWGREQNTEDMELITFQVVR